MLGDRLKHLRNLKGWTQEDVAKKLGMSRGTYAHYEINKRQPDYETLKTISSLFEVSTDYLLSRTDNHLSDITAPIVGVTNQPIYKDLGMRISAMISGRKIPRTKILDMLDINSDELFAILNGDESLNDDQAEKLSRLLNVRKEMLLPTKTASLDKDEKDIAKRLEQIKKDLESGSEGDGLAFHGEPMSEEAIDSLMDAMELIVRQTQRINKKYIPKKYRDKETE